jgi:hypothetical protein
MKWLILIFNVACLTACKHPVDSHRAAEDGAGDAFAITPSATPTPLVFDDLTCELHVSKAPAAEPGGRAALVPWEDSSPEHARGTVLVAERIHRRLVVFEWDVAAGVEMRRVSVGAPGDFFDASMMRNGDELHLVVASGEGPGGGRKIVHFVLDRSLRVLAQHAVGLGELPVLLAANGVVAIASFERRGWQFQGFLRTFSYPAWTPLATVEFPFADGEIAALQYAGGGNLVAEFSPAVQTRLVVYNAATLERGATWGPNDGSYAMGVVQGHTAVLGNGMLTEFSDSLEIRRSRPLPGAGDFMEDPDTGAIATVRGELFFHGKAICCSPAGERAGAASAKDFDATAETCSDRRYPMRFSATGVMFQGTVVTLRTTIDDSLMMPRAYNDDWLVWFDTRKRAPL